MLPEDLPGCGRKPYHSKFELIRTDESSKEFITNVIKQVYVLRQQEFKSKFPQPLNELKKAGAEGGLEEPYQSDYFFFRQRYIGASSGQASVTNQLLPELKPICVCQKILNLDEETRECPGCKAAFHPDCMRQQLDIKCISCKE